MIEPGYSAQRDTRTVLPGVNSVRVNGPVPSEPVAPYLSPSFARVARLQIIEYSVARVSGRAASGFWSLITTVLPGPVVIVIGGQNTAFCPTFGSLKMLKLATTSLAVHGAPDWNFRPSRIFITHVRPPFVTFQLDASAGTIFPLGSRITVYS